MWWWLIVVALGVLWLIVLIPPLFDSGRVLQKEVDRHDDTLNALKEASSRAKGG
jgi:hypothetical protein